MQCLSADAQYFEKLRHRHQSSSRHEKEHAVVSPSKPVFGEQAIRLLHDRTKSEMDERKSSIQFIFSRYINAVDISGHIDISSRR
jgi:hypothetical protein